MLSPEQPPRTRKAPCRSASIKDDHGQEAPKPVRKSPAQPKPEAQGEVRQRDGKPRPGSVADASRRLDAAGCGQARGQAGREEGRRAASAAKKVRRRQARRQAAGQALAARPGQARAAVKPKVGKPVAEAAGQGGRGKASAARRASAKARGQGRGKVLAKPARGKAAAARPRRAAKVRQGRCRRRGTAAAAAGAQALAGEIAARSPASAPKTPRTRRARTAGTPSRAARADAGRRRGAQAPPEDADRARQGARLPHVRRDQRSPARRHPRRRADRGRHLDDRRHGDPGLRRGPRRRNAADVGTPADGAGRGRRGGGGSRGSTLDSEFGRTTDPVRMYMREMGSVELLTREGEIEIAKRIEEGLKHMIMAISACPMTVGADPRPRRQDRQGRAQDRRPRRRPHGLQRGTDARSRKPSDEARTRRTKPTPAPSRARTSSG